MPKRRMRSRSRSNSRSRSKSREKRRERKERKYDILFDQVSNLTQVVQSLVAQKASSQKEIRPTDNHKEPSLPEKSPPDHNSVPKTVMVETSGDKENDGSAANVNTEGDIETLNEKHPEQESSEPVDDESRDTILKALGVDLNESKFKEVKFHPELKNTWGKWMKEGLPDKNKKEILELYNRKGEMFTEAPKINLEIVPLLSDIARKRDQHFMDTQNCIGTALTALGGAVSMIIDPPEEGLNEDTFLDYLSHAGQLLSDVFHQQSAARKSFITPQLNKNIKPTVDAMISDEWLYGNNLKDKVKDAKEIEKACAEIKDKSKKETFKAPNQGNSKGPTVFRQSGQLKKRLKFKRKSVQNSTQNTSKGSTTQTKNPSSFKS